jgi:3-deoxy-manno-octulosonate cytidylyltransferase (CMP-KDO synthetase)
MRTAVVIPARYYSSRLPAKPLLRDTGKYLIQHVYEQASRAKRADAVIVATDDSRIESAVEEFGGKVAWTWGGHPSGTDRVAQVARNLDADVIVNVQGDEPLIDPAAIDSLSDLLERDPTAEVATLAVPITSEEQFRNPNCVKVVCDGRGRALYFSRSPIPFVRDGKPDFAARPARFLQHLGIYAYRRRALLQLASLPTDPLEEFEKLEQLRVLGLGWRIQVGVVASASIGVDTPEDYRRFVELYRRQAVARAA